MGAVRHRFCGNVRTVAMTATELAVTAATIWFTAAITTVAAWNLAKWLVTR